MTISPAISSVADVRVGNADRAQRQEPVGERTGKRLGLGAIAGLHRRLEPDRQAEVAITSGITPCFNSGSTTTTLKPVAQYQHGHDAGEQEREPQRRAGDVEEEQHRERR